MKYAYLFIVASGAVYIGSLALGFSYSQSLGFMNYWMTFILTITLIIGLVRE